ncbi:unnamed protein product [Soboliphyme baturini]|uniref:DUF1115 domain-containing protein n=1 Tax=Soboliphyme baturini TaxID=241478 RepID=A0A183IKM4_9BILA|nr:unnamed protein product [Soboliphyme baturini]
MALLKSLKKQLFELELLESMYAVSEEMFYPDDNCVAPIRSFIDGQTNELPSVVLFTLNLKDAAQNRVEITFQFPLMYPDEMRPQCISYIASLPLGEPMVCEIVWWILNKVAESASCTFSDPCIDQTRNDVLDVVGHKGRVSNGKSFSRLWIFCHHIFNSWKRRNILTVAKSLDLTGFCLPGKPGIVAVEGLKENCCIFWRTVKTWTWKKIMIKNSETMTIENEADIDGLRKFIDFQEISFVSTVGLGRTVHMDMGDFRTYLADHHCEEAFKMYFGVASES